MNDPFARLAFAMARYRWIVLIVWVAGLAVAGSLLAPHAASVMKSGAIVVPGSDSDTVDVILEDQFNLSTLNNAALVFRSDELAVDDPQFKQDVQTAAERLASQEGVRNVITFYSTGNPGLVSPDGHTTVAIVSLIGKEGDAQDLVPGLREQLEDLTIEHYMTGTPPLNYDFTTRSEHDLRKAELVTIPVVLLLLIFTFRTIIAAAVPLILGGASVVLAMSVLYVIGSRTDVSIFAVNVASMIGLGLGIDFSLIVVNRFREEMRAGRDVPTALAATMATAGRSITYSGITVLLGMLVLTVMFDLLIVRSISLGVMLVAFTALLSGLTLLPALLAILGHRLEWLRVMPKRRERGPEYHGFWYRFSHAVMRRPWLWLSGATAILLVLAYPALELRLLGSDPGLLPAETEAVAGARHLDEAFGANRLTPIQIIMRTDQEGGVWTPEFLGALEKLTHLIQDDPRTADVTSLETFANSLGVSGGQGAGSFTELQPDLFTSDPQRAAAASQFVNLGGANDTAVISIVSKYGEFTPEHEAQIDELRQEILPGTEALKPYTFYVGGSAASFLDFRDKLYGRFPYLVAAVLLLSFVILMMFFQSLFLPFKAILLNVAGVLATYGVLVMIFQHGWGSGVFDFAPLGAIGVATPAILFVILFSLSTDYEVFMLSRVKEYYHELGDNEEAVARGLENTAGVITAAGLILIGVFGSFATAGIITIKEVGLGLAIAILIDTTLIRVVMVPASMRLMGDWNWWMPGWLKRIVPEIREGQIPQLAPAAAMAGGGLAPIGVAEQPSAGVPALPSTRPATSALLRPIDGPPGIDVIPLPKRRPFIVGRTSSADLQVVDPRVSRTHARIERRDDGYMLTDLNSTNGVYVNGTRVEGSTLLANYDLIEIANFGEVRLRFEEGEVADDAM